MATSPSTSPSRSSDRAKLKQLAEDLAWLEGYCRKSPELQTSASEIHLAAALARNVLGGKLEGQPVLPLHIAVVGGAGAGKSTVVNLLSGTAVADANPQAGYTRHPTAFLPAGLAASLPAYFGFLAPLRRAMDDIPANLDEDVYQVRRIPASPDLAGDPIHDFVIWDCPDMTTWAATGYVSRLMEVAALADVLVYVASDERYNDEIPTQFLQLLVRAGKAVIVCLTKMRPENVAPLLDHFRSNVLGRITELGEIPPVPCIAIPHLSPSERVNPARAANYRVQLLNQLLVLCPTPTQARERTLQNAIRYLQSSGDRALEVANKDLAELELWKAVVESGRTMFEARYRREYLAGEPFRRFDRTREQLLAMLELPGSIQYLSTIFSFLRMPYHYARTFLMELTARPNPPSLPEQTVLSTAFAAWLEALQTETLRRNSTHPVWTQLSAAFDSDFKREALDRFQSAARQFELTESTELEQAGRSLTDGLAARTSLLGAIRASKLLADLIAIGLVLYWTWVPSWYHFLLIPLVVALTHQVAELVVRGTVEAARTSARLKREAVLREQLTEPLATWLTERPSLGGSSIERLQTVLTRMPKLIEELSPMLTSSDRHENPSPVPATSAPMP